MTFAILMLALSLWAWAAIVAVALLFFGAGRIPKLARSLGESKRALKAQLAEKKGH